jgi:hypothetical protein
MKTLEIKTITKRGFESVEELIQTLKSGEVTVYITPDGYDDGISVSFCGDFIIFQMPYSGNYKRISLDKLDYNQFYTKYTNITTY